MFRSILLCCHDFSRCQMPCTKEDGENRFGSFNGVTLAHEYIPGRHLGCSAGLTFSTPASSIMQPTWEVSVRSGTFDSMSHSIPISMTTNMDLRKTALQIVMKRNLVTRCRT